MSIDLKEPEPTRLPLPIMLAMGVALLPFAITVNWISRTSGPSGSTCSYIDYAAIACGAAAILLGLRAAGSARVRPMVRFGGAAAAIALGAFQVARGFGMVFSPC